jgi:ubiquitin
VAHAIPSRDSNLKQIFKEKVPCTDQDLIGQQLIASLKWLIYAAAYEDCSTLDHEKFHQKQVVRFQNRDNYKIWRALLYKELEEWYTEHPPASKKRKRSSGASRIANVIVDEEFFPVDNFVDFLEDLESDVGTAGGARAGPLPAAAALAAVASAAAGADHSA